MGGYMNSYSLSKDKYILYSILYLYIYKELSRSAQLFFFKIILYSHYQAKSDNFQFSTTDGVQGHSLTLYLLG